MATRVNISRAGFFFFFKETVDDAAFYRDRDSFLQNRESVLSRLRIARMTQPAKHAWTLLYTYADDPRAT